MIEKTDGTHIGDLCFKGLREDGIAEIGYGILEEHQGQGYATESIGTAVNWALRQSGVTRVEAETEPDNRASQRVLKSAAFSRPALLGRKGLGFTEQYVDRRLSGKVHRLCG